MAEPIEADPYAHYILLSKDRYLHTRSWYEECESITKFYLDKKEVTPQEVFTRMLPAVYYAILVTDRPSVILVNDGNGNPVPGPSDTPETEFTHMFLVMFDYLSHIEMNRSILFTGWKEALALAALTILGRCEYPESVYLGVPDPRILPIPAEEPKPWKR